MKRKWEGEECGLCVETLQKVNSLVEKKTIEDAAFFCQAQENLIFKCRVSSFNRVPKEVILIILNFVGDWRQISLVCKDWRQMCKHLPCGPFPQDRMILFLWTLSHVMKNEIISSFSIELEHGILEQFSFKVKPKEEGLAISVSAKMLIWVLSRSRVRDLLRGFGWTLKNGEENIYESGKDEWETDWEHFLSSLPTLKHSVGERDSDHMVHSVQIDFAKIAAIWCGFGDDHPMWKYIGILVTDKINCLKSSMIRRGCIKIRSRKFVNKDVRQLSLFVRSFWE